MARSGSGHLEGCGANPDPRAGLVISEIRWAIFIAGLTGLLLGVLDSTLPARRARYLPSAAALGLAFVLPASVSLMMALGAVLTWTVSCRWASLTERFAITAAAGLIAGESITGVGASLWQMFGNG
ncbi:Oligopeptide transporter, OPT family [Pseudomonas syringae pv. coriandricola]|uniref:Oligopeptide transporter, OPT family n=1 Tax=Pseudomonas syringae pv. coriandricola TaxID=264453 RepID=A0A3M4UF47_9PSED|nr:Oligopeptide transporter, OPT family [Pseudomonas syringae pv. coriandricola]RMU10488.1 Oligopeptide transporter, OPT family [Pseudomonas syringae pv. coriandricola]